MLRLLILIFIFVPYMALLTETTTSRNIIQFREDDNTTDRCNDLLEEFAKQASKFSLCAVIHARPIHLCQKCVDQFQNVTTVFDMIQKETNSKGQHCKEVLLNSDRLGVIQQVNSSVEDLWNRANCESCFTRNQTTNHYEPSKNTLKFILLLSAAKACINNHTHRDDYENSTVCTDCEKDYCDLNAFYNELKAVEEDAVCMDIVDSMNRTRILWSDELRCVKRHSTADVPLFTVASFVSLLPLIFYVGATLFSSRIPNRVQAQKRLAQHINPSTSQDG